MAHAISSGSIKSRGHSPNDDASTNPLWLALRNLTAQWTRTADACHAAMNQFGILYGDRFLRAPT